MEHRTISLADQIFEKLETDILLGRYQRGETVTEIGLVSDLGVSRTPIREALRRLEQEHLVETTGKGILIVGVTESDMADIMQIRLHTEGLASARAAARITEDELKSLLEALELQEYYLTKQDADHIKTFDSAFHEYIYRFSGSTILCDTLTPLHKKVQKYRKVSVEDVSRAACSVREHRAIYEALAAHDPATAEARTIEHIRNAMAHIEK